MAWRQAHKCFVFRTSKPQGGDRRIDPRNHKRKAEHPVHQYPTMLPQVKHRAPPRCRALTTLPLGMLARSQRHSVALDFEANGDANNLRGVAHTLTPTDLEQGWWIRVARDGGPTRGTHGGGSAQPTGQRSSSGGSSSQHSWCCAAISDFHERRSRSGSFHRLKRGSTLVSRSVSPHAPPHEVPNG